MICTISTVIIINILLKLVYSKVCTMGRVERDQLIEVGKIYLPLFVVLYVYTLYNAGDGGDIEARYRGDQYLFE